MHRSRSTGNECVKFSRTNPKSTTNRGEGLKATYCRSFAPISFIETKGMTEQLAEYESQLADVIDLLEASPADESLMNLKADLEELIAITKQSFAAGQAEEAIHGEGQSLASALDAAASKAVSTAVLDDLEHAPTPSVEPPKKKAKVSKEFDVPKHLIIIDTDTEAEKNRKKRAVKALKSKWREQKKQAESEKKQKSWQNFSKKKVKSKSIFSTSDSTDAKVGVVSVSRTLTDQGERKRHKHA
jgi:survival-of-motor-neuron-related-splicing factor 30